jgi:hypothetical protein
LQTYFLSLAKKKKKLDVAGVLYLAFTATSHLLNRCTKPVDAVISVQRKVKIKLIQTHCTEP